MHLLASLATVTAFAAAAVAQTAPAMPLFTPGSVRIDGQSYPFQLLEPLPHRREVARPLVVFLHGAGERGTDNQRQLTWLPNVLAAADAREAWPCYVLAVQCPAEAQWVEVPWGEVPGRPFPVDPSPAMRAVLAALDEVTARPGVDPARIYLTGLSMGGYGCFDLACRAPQRFAAVLAVCGGGDPARADALVGLPLAVVHGADDRVVPVQRSQQMVAAVRARGGNVQYRELPGVGHDAWKHAYAPAGELDWLFAQDQRQQPRGAWLVPPCVPTVGRFAPQPGRFLFGPAGRIVAAPDARSAASPLVDLVAARTGRRPPFVADQPLPGDLVLEVDAQATADLVLVLGTTLQVRARSLDLLGRGVALAWQALHGEPGLACGAGTLVLANVPPAGRLALRGELGAWSAAAVEQLLQRAWMFGVTTIEAPDLPAMAALDPAVRTAHLAAAARCGIELVGTNGAPGDLAAYALAGPEGQLHSVAELLAAAPPTALGGFRLELPDLPAPALLAALQTALPAVVERAGRPAAVVHRGAFLARLGCLLRNGD